MTKTNKVYIATSIDGFIADKDGGLAWLDTISEVNNIDTGYHAFTAEIDALVMGRVSYETILSFDIEWPYQKPVYVASTTLQSIPEELTDKVFLIKGSISEMLKEIHSRGHHKLYIDGGKLIQSFLKEDLIDEMIVTVIPILLGGGHPLFGVLDKTLNFECQETKLFLEAIVQNRFVRKR